MPTTEQSPTPPNRGANRPAVRAGEPQGTLVESQRGHVDPDLRGRRLVLIRCVGEGGFGQVYEGRVETPGGLNRRVAVKLVRDDVVQDGMLERAIDEAHLLSRLSHPNVVAVEDLTHVDGRLAIISEFVDGVDLAEVEAMPAPAALEMVAKVAEALQAAWDADGPDGRPMRIIHRDIKPSNIRLGRHGVVKLLDFGIAIPEGGARRVKTQSGMLIGSLGYMAPERWSAGGAERASDIYALGCVLFRALTGTSFLSDIAPAKQLKIASDALRHDAYVEERVGEAQQHHAVIELVRDMLAWEASARPLAVEVARAARKAAGILPGDGLLAWSSQIQIHRSDWSRADGQVMLETDRGFTLGDMIPAVAGRGSTRAPASSPRRWWRSGLLSALVGATAVFVFAAFIIGIIAAAGGVAWWGGAFDSPSFAPGTPDVSDVQVVPDLTVDEPTTSEAMEVVSVDAPLDEAPKTMTDPTPAPKPATKPARKTLVREVSSPDVSRVEPEPEGEPTQSTTAVGEVADSLTPPEAPPAVQSNEGPKLGRFVVDDWTKVRLRGVNEAVYGLGEVPAGQYSLEVAWDGINWSKAGDRVAISSGATTRYRCVVRFRRCVEVQ